ncbi:MAG: hypothetical protein J6U54_14625 [Clostridiales bacterium]|nr:hypothetical protein [Clostridiales bacterium]
MKDKVSYVLMGLLTLALVLSIVAYILVPVVTFIILSVIDIVFLIILFALKAKKKKIPLFVCSIIFTTLFVFNVLFWGLFHMPVSTNRKWQYPFAMKYTYDSDKAPEFIPAKLPDSADDFHFEFLPTILQGTGHVGVSFTADESYINELKAKLEGEAMYVVDYDKLGDLNASLDSDESDYGGYKYIALWEYNVPDEHPNATVYILDTNYNWNHPHSKAVFIDGNYVLFSDQ